MLGLSLGLSGSPGLPRAAAEQLLIAPGSLAANLAFARASGGGRFTVGGALQEVGVNVPRFSGPAQRLLVEPLRDNQIRNPRMEGAAAGTSGTLPTNFSVIASTLGLSRTILGTGIEDGIPFLEMRLFGTPNTTGAFRLALEGSTAVTAAQGQSWALSLFMRLTGGTIPAAGAPQLGLQQRDAGGSPLGPPFLADIAAPTGASLALQRSARNVVLNQASTAVLSPELRFPVQSGVPVDFTYRIGAPQLEMGGFASSPILPPVGTLAQSSRAQDLVTGSMAALFPDRRGTLLLVATLPAVPVGAAPLLTARRSAGVGLFSAYLAADGSGIRLATRDGSGLDDVAVPGSWSTGGELRLGLTFDESRGLLQAVAGGAAASLSPRTAAAQGELHVGRTMLAPGGDDAPGFIEVAKLLATQRVMAGAEMNARLAAL